MATLDANKFFDTENVLSEIKSLKQENQIQDASIVKVVNSFAGLENALVKLDNSTESFIEVVTKDAKLRERREATSLQKRRQDILLGQKTTKSNEPPSMPMAAGGASPSAFTASTFAAGVAAAMISGGLNGGPENTDNAPSASGVSGSGNQEKAFNYFIKLGLSKEQAAGIVGNLMVESYTDIKPTADNGTHRGIAQWDKQDRWPRLVSWANSKNKDPEKFETQLEYLAIESGYLNTFKNKKFKTAAEAAIEWERMFERSGGQSNDLRKQYANSVLERYGKSSSTKGSTSQSGLPTPLATPGPQASSSMRTPVASASVPSSSKADGMHGKSKMDAPEYDASQLGIIAEPTKQDSLAMPSMASVPPSALVPPKTMEDQQAPLSMLPMTPQMTAANVITSNPLTSTNPVEDPKNLDRLMFKMSWGIVA